ncbi:MAG: heparin lyase I family protein [Nitrospirota bacterium]
MKKASIFFTLIAIITNLYYPDNSFSAVNLPWSSTYNCSDWTQSNGLSTVNCDGLRGEGGWTCDNGDGTVREEQITAAANYPGGSGGKGQRHWLGDGVNNLSGGLAASFQSSQSEIWVRWYMRYEQGFEWNPYLMNQKILYFDPTSFPRLIVGYYGQDRVWIYSYASGQGYPSVGNGWNTIMANGGTDVRGNKTSDGQWHLWEFHVKMDTNGSNGVLELWIDQVKVINVTNANLGTTVLQYVLIGSNGFTPGNGRCMYVDFDDIIISGVAASTTVSSSGSSDSPSGGGCGFIKEDFGRSGSDAIQIALLLLPLILIRLWKLLKVREWNY